MPTHFAPAKVFPERLCAVIATPTAREAVRQLREATRYTRTIELRLDWLRSDRERSSFLKTLRKIGKKGLTLVATCRRILGVGKLAGGAQTETYWVSQARATGWQWSDPEIATLTRMPGQ